jgi:hypothetical protein
MDLDRNLTARSYCPLRRASAPMSRHRSACSLFTFYEEEEEEHDIRI